MMARVSNASVDEQKMRIARAYVLSFKKIKMYEIN